MKRQFLLALCLAGVTQVSHATSPCEVVLCMTKPGSSECMAAEQKFYSIAAFTSSGGFDPRVTARLRKRYLNQCSSADPSFVNKIIDQFGGKR